ncbi:chitin deacetylase [Moniliophthora roreri]|nr:chitin deacetylase [Moniliophthora roreri]
MKLLFPLLTVFVASGVALPAEKKRQALATVYYSCTRPNTVAFTFDDGPCKDAMYTAILELKKGRIQVRYGCRVSWDATIPENGWPPEPRSFLEVLNAVEIQLGTTNTFNDIFTM